ncbi:hypothetical protein N0V88_007721 [Collariella sp. IMI 366227]|nr:hypothetical protein N0V88_007721 [Collariella sp. IMI 366227]
MEALVVPSMAAEGSERAIQTLYEGKETYQLESKQKALVVRMRKAHGDNREKPLGLHSIVVQSPSLKRTLAEVFEGYKGVTASLKKLVFKAPFQPFHHVWDRFTEILERQKREDPESASYTQLLYDTVYAELRDTRAEVADLLENGVITYSLLWALFKPGMTVIACQPDEEARFYVVDGCDYNHRGRYAGLNARFVDYDGNRFGYANELITISSFGGTRNITELPAFPIGFHPMGEEAKAKAITRGHKFQDLAGIHYLAYSGLMKYHGGRDMNQPMERYTSGRIMIDVAGYFQQRVGFSDPIMVTPLGTGTLQPTISVSDDVHNPDFAMLEHPPMPYIVDDLPSSSQAKSPAPTILTNVQLLLCSPTLRGYSLKLKLWGVFSVSGVSPISFNETAFPNLMVPPSYKDLILSFVEAHPGSSNTAKTASATDANPMFDDLIEGKGLGVILLLVGNPGTGKTLTAEAVADKVHRPLYVLSAGELGMSAGDVDERLQGALELAERWDAVLLLDECDVFLQERTPESDLGRNEVVAVFLRLLEYYRGILFMTTNRGETIDRAFHSRIHLTLRYPDLDAPAKEHIWRHFTKLAGVDDSFTAEVYDKLAVLPINGRQIKNTVRIATLVAAREKVPLGVEHVQIAVEATQGPEAVGPLGTAAWNMAIEN